MTTDYTDDDVKAVQGTAICGPTQARRLLDAGYRKVAPEPEPLEMWEVVEGCVLRDTVEARRWDLGSGAFAERVARLLNIDEAAKAGGSKGLRHRAVTAEAERDEARAEVERLTALVREVAAAGVATTNRKYVEVQVDVDTWADLRAEIGEPPADGHYFDMPTEGTGLTRIIAKVPVRPTPDDATGRTDPEDELYLILHGTRERLCVWSTENPRRDLVEAIGPVVRAIDRCGALLPQWSRFDHDYLLPGATGRTDTATEPLFTGRMIGHSEDGGGTCEVVILLPAWPGEQGRDVDVYPAGVRPAAPTITADMVREVWEVLLPRLIAGSYSDAADAFNRLLAERGGEG